MSEVPSIAALLATASDGHLLTAAQVTAAKRLLAFDGEVFPADGCAITMSVLLQMSNIDVPDTFKAFELVKLLEERDWQRVIVGQQQQGDVGTTCGPTPNHGVDHVYLVLKKVNVDEMVIADNQAPAPHFRFASGTGGKSPTTFFLRAS